MVRVEIELPELTAWALSEVASANGVTQGALVARVLASVTRRDIRPAADRTRDRRPPMGFVDDLDRIIMGY